MPTGPALLAQAQALVQAQALALAQASEATTVAKAQRDKAAQGGRMLAASLAAATDKNTALQSKNDALHTKVAALQALLEQERANGVASQREAAAALAAGREQAAALEALEAERESERTVHAKLQAEQRRTGHTRRPAAGPATCRSAPSHSIRGYWGRLLGLGLRRTRGLQHLSLHPTLTPTLTLTRARALPGCRRSWPRRGVRQTSSTVSCRSTALTRTPPGPPCCEASRPPRGLRLRTVRRGACRALSLRVRPGATSPRRWHVRHGASALCVRATRTSPLRAVPYRRGAGQLPRGATLCVHTGYAYRPRACRTYRVPWNPRPTHGCDEPG